MLGDIYLNHDMFNTCYKKLLMFTGRIAIDLDDIKNLCFPYYLYHYFS